MKRIDDYLWLFYLLVALIVALGAISNFNARSGKSLSRGREPVMLRAPLGPGPMRHWTRYQHRFDHLDPEHEVHPGESRDPAH